MNAAPRMLFSLFLCLALPRIEWTKAGPTDDLLPVPVRPAEKRALGGIDERARRSYLDGRGAVGAAFSPDGKLLLTGWGYPGITLWDVETGRPVGQFTSPSPNDGLSITFTPDGKQVIGASWGLHNLGRLAMPALRKAIEGKPALEMKQRLEQLLDQSAKTTPPELLRVGRALEALELMGGLEADQSLNVLAHEGKAPWLRLAAGESLRRQRAGSR